MIKRGEKDKRKRGEEIPEKCQENYLKKTVTLPLSQSRNRSEWIWLNLPRFVRNLSLSDHRTGIGISMELFFGRRGG
jgi:hypothetical protein